MNIKRYLVFMRFNKGLWILGFIFLLAFIIRIIYVSQVSAFLSGDAVVYDRLGLSISQGKGYVDNSGMPHSLYPPLYPLFLSLIYTFFGHSYFVVRFVQSIIAVFSILCIYLIAKKVNGIAAGIVAAFMSMGYWPFISSAGLLLTEMIFTFLFLLIVFYILKIQESPAIKNSIILGILLGMAVLTKAVMLFFPLFVMPLFIYLTKKYGFIVFKNYIIVLVVFVLTMSPWVIRNYNVYHKFVPVSAAGGLGFYSSYCPRGGIFGLLAAPDDPVIIEAGKFSSPVLSSNFLVKKTLDFIVNNPKEALRLELKKILYFWVPFDWEIMGVEKGIFNFQYMFILPFSFFGMFLLAKRFYQYVALYIPILYLFVMSLVFYGSPRFRMPIEPCLIIFFSIGIFRFFKIFSNRYIPSLIVLLYAGINIVMYLYTDMVKYFIRDVAKLVGL